MKKLFIAFIIFGVYGVGFCLFPGGQLYAQETLTIIEDHFEFRDTPRVSEETLMGTLRLGTPVEWTGNVSGKWFEVKAPNGQVGWVHESGLSRPTSPIKPTPTPSPSPSPSTSRSVLRPLTQTSQLEANIQKLEEVNSRYKKDLNKKEQELQKLSTELTAVKKKLSDSEEMSEKFKQSREEEEQKLTEVQNELSAFQDTLNKKDEDLSTQKAEMEELQNQLKDLRLQQDSSLSLERLLLAISIPLNILGLIVLGYLGIRHSRQNQEAKAVAETGVFLKGPEEVSNAEQSFDAQIEDQATMGPYAGQTTTDAEPESALEELDVVMNSSTSEEEFPAVEERESLFEKEEQDEEEMIAVIGALPEEYGDIKDLEETIGAADIEMESEEVIIIGEPIEAIDAELEEISEIPVDVEETIEEEDAALTEARIEELLEESQEEESIEELLRESQEELIGELAEDKEEILEVIEEEESFQGLLEESDEVRVEIEVEPEEIEEELGAEMHEELDIAMEESSEDASVIEENTGFDELLEAGELEEIETTPTEEITQEVEIEGEKFQRLPESNTQLIETGDEQEETFEEEGVHDEEEQEESEEDVLIGHPGIIEELESIEETPVNHEVLEEDREESEQMVQEAVDDDSEQFTSMVEQETRMFEPEEDQEDVLEGGISEEYEEEPASELLEEDVERFLEEEGLEDEDIEGFLEEEGLEENLDELEAEDAIIEEEGLEEIESSPEAEDAIIEEEGPGEIEYISELETEEGEDTIEEGVGEIENAPPLEAEVTDEEVSQAAPSLLEPSPFLIEPEYEPEELTADTPEQTREVKYDIELSDVGENQDSIVHILSKIEGLTGSPQELVANIPCIIARGASKADAQNFQVVMKKFGSEVRLIEK